MNPELPFLAAGTIAIGAGVAREGGWPRQGTTALIATLVLVVVASSTANSRVAPLVRAVGLLLVLSAVISAVHALNAKKGKK